MTTANVWMPESTLSALHAERVDLEARGEARTLSETARLAELRTLVRNADVGVKPNDGLVEPGMLVSLLFDDGTAGTFLLGDRAVLNDRRALSPTSPLGSAVNGRRVGDQVSYTAPNARITVSVVAAEPAV